MRSRVSSAIDHSRFVYRQVMYLVVLKSVATALRGTGLGWGKQVRKGEPLFDIYSPELYSTQNEYVLALGQGAGGLKASHERTYSGDILL